MKSLNIFIRSTVFFIFFIFSTIILFIFLLTAFLIRNNNLFKKISLSWVKLIINSLKLICKIDYKVEGTENLPKDKNYLVVSKHQSTWETYFMYCFFENTGSFVLKKELLNIPIIGFGLKRTGHIPIDRNGGALTIKKTIIEAKKIIDNEKRNIIIFPQGTRVPIGKTTQEYPYKTGFLGIVKTLKLDMLPIALNTGCFWPKKAFIKKPGTITIKILPVIKYENILHLSKEEIINNIENIIETESNRLI